MRWVDSARPMNNLRLHKPVVGVLGSVSALLTVRVHFLVKVPWILIMSTF